MSAPCMDSAEAGSGDMLLKRTLDRPESCQCSLCRLGAWRPVNLPPGPSAAVQESVPTSTKLVTVTFVRFQCSSLGGPKARA